MNTSMHHNAVSFKNLIKDSDFLSERGLSLYHINAYEEYEEQG